MKNFLSSMQQQLRGLAVEEDGAQIIEYALIIAVVSLTLIVAMSTDSIGFDDWIGRVKVCLDGSAACV